jgi:hypothetical protein
MPKKEYKLDVYTPYDDNSLIHVCDIAFDSGKGACGLIVTKHCVTTVFVYGKFVDAVRVYSALKNNGYKPSVWGN